MKSKGLHGFNLWLEKKLSFPGCTDRQLQGNKTVFYNHIFLAIAPIIVFLIPLLIFAPQATIFIYYMIAIGGLYTLSLLLQLMFPSRYMVTHLCISISMYLMFFYAMIRLGGIPTSGGLIFAGIANVFATVPRRRTWFPISMFSLFCVMVVLLVVLKPWLHVPEQMTPELNSILFAGMGIALTGSALGFVLQFIWQQRKLEELEARHLKEMDEFKDHFFTNITHEFRTPLTIIEGMADLIKAKPEQWMGTGLQKIKTNSRVLLRLVNQMLNLAKAQAGALSVSLVRRDINVYLAYLVEQFSSEALRRKIDLKFKSTGIPFEMDFDPEKIMHIITNLISNALKYTTEGGRVEVITGVGDIGKMFFVRVKDTGIGIEREHLNHLFDRFYRVNHQLSPEGTGIGLALTKEMVLILQGRISVESVMGEGSEFTVHLPVTCTAPLSESPDLSDLIKFTDYHYEKGISSGEPVYPGKILEELLSAGTIIPSKLPLLLIIEDSPDVILYLQSILKYEYRIELAENGKAGLEKALELIPDIILSDVMMPVMDGIELLEKAKKDIRTSHIPVVMLTAKADIDSRLVGLERGADAYLAKPVDERELHFQLKNLVELRKRLYQRYKSLDKYPESSDINIKKEDDFMIRVRRILETNLREEEFGISQLCRELAVSQSQLYRKFKSLCNITIADYFKLLRLHKARELLLTTSLNITEVAYSTGFRSLAYFSREFTHRFGQSPSKFRK
jgi:signal transduction histidine kinase/DNA-binding response OmpR family regulator